MSKISITAVVGSQSVGGTRDTINENFNIITNAVNSVLESLDTDSKEIKNIKSLSVTSQNTSVTDILIKTNGSVSAGGNLIVEKAISGNSATIESNVVINKGSLILNSENSEISCPGKFTLGGEFVMTDFSESQVINASYNQAWQTSTSNNLIILKEDGTYEQKTTSNTGTIVGGIINMVGRSGIILNWGEYGNDSSHQLDCVMLGTTGVITGQRVTIIAKLGTNSGSHTFKIVPNSIAYPSGKVLNSINFINSYDTAEFIFDGVNWIPVSVKGAVISYAA